MDAQDPIAEYLTQADRTARPPTGATGDAAHVETLFNEIRLPWRPDDSPGWQWEISADIGEVNSRIEPETRTLLLFQGVGRVSGKPKDHADTMHLLMQANSTSQGACFGIDMQGERDGYFILVSRVPLASLSREALLHALDSFFAFSRTIDEMAA